VLDRPQQELVDGHAVTADQQHPLRPEGRNERVDARGDLSGTPLFTSMPIRRRPACTTKSTSRLRSRQ
jgi:hypothetical protein